MSAAAQLARDEADAIDAEEADAEESEPEPEAQPDQPEAQAAPEAPAFDPDAFEKAVLTESKRHRRVVEKLMDGQTIYPCEHCGELGYALVPPDDEPEIALLKGAIRCDECNGWGRLRTPSIAPGHETVECQRCSTKGYIVEQVQVPAPQPMQLPPFPGAAEQYMPLAGGTPDGWGRPAGHPHWGIDPTMITG